MQDQSTMASVLLVALLLAAVVYTEASNHTASCKYVMGMLNHWLSK